MDTEVEDNAASLDDEADENPELGDLVDAIES